MTVVTLMKTVIWHDQESETMCQRLRDVDEVHGMSQEVGMTCGLGQVCLGCVGSRFFSFQWVWFGLVYCIPKVTILL